jgi:hypothetical protein
MIGERFGPTTYGQKGVLTQIGPRVQCHMCGKAFHHLGNHVRCTHQLSADEYCDEFGLKRSTGLISPALASKRRLTASLLNDDVRVRAMARAAEERQTRHWGRQTGHSLEERMTPKYVERQRDNVQSALAGVARSRANGTYPFRPFPDAAVNSAKGRARHKQFIADPLRHQQWRAKISAAKLQPTEYHCSVCGASFTAGRYKGRRRTCGVECLHESKRRNAVSLNARRSR